MNPGIHDISEADYHSDIGEQPSLSSSIVKILATQSPLHAWTEHSRLNPHFVREEKEIFDLGTVAHALMLQGVDHACVLDYPDWRKPEARVARDEARAAGRTPILTKHWARVKEMVAAGRLQIAAHREASDAFTDGFAEQTLAWTDTATDGTVVRCKGRLDWLKTNRRRIFDYKATGTSVNPETIARFAIAQGWDIQAFFYLRGLKVITGIDAEFFFVAQEDYPPYAMTIAGMGPDFLWSGQQKVQDAIDTWAQCMTSGKWPGYSDRIIYPSLPSFEETRITEKQLRSVR